MTVNNFLQHPGDFNTHFDDDYEVLQWTAESGVTLSRYESDPDTDHSSVMKMVTTDATHGTYIGQTVYENMKYVFEFQYKCDTGKELKIRVYDVTHNAWITLDPHTICSSASLSGQRAYARS